MESSTKTISFINSDNQETNTNNTNNTKTVSILDSDDITKLDSNTNDTETNQEVFLVKNVPIPTGSSLELLSGNKVVLQNTDVLKVDCDTSAKIDATLSIMEIT